MRKCVLCHMRTTKAQISRFYSQNFKTLASFVAAQARLCLAWSESPEDTFPRGVAHIILSNLLARLTWS